MTRVDNITKVAVKHRQNYTDIWRWGAASPYYGVCRSMPALW